jgi:predicted aldo/keto reductase-like oxidoreductase
VNVKMPYRNLGRINQKVSILGLGGYHIGMQNVSEEESQEIIRAAIDHGVNFLDNSWDYNNGVSEIRMGRALRNGYREKVFLMTKIDGRDRNTAEKQIDESISRLGTHIDLLQFHEIIRPSDPERIFASDGAFEAAIEARDAGKIRYIGFTGHKSPDIHLRMLKTGFDKGLTFDTVQMPLNVMDAHYDSFEKQVLPVLIEHGIGVLGMKPFGDKNILNSGVVTAQECLRYSLSLPVSAVITGIDSMSILEQALAVVRNFAPMSSKERSALLVKTAKAAERGKYEPYKTTDTYDATTHNPNWMG